MDVRFLQNGQTQLVECKGISYLAQSQALCGELDIQIKQQY